MQPKEPNVHTVSKHLRPTGAKCNITSATVTFVMGEERRHVEQLIKPKLMERIRR